MAPTYSQLRERAVSMRKNPTRAEQILWGRLRKRRVLNCKFRRQHILAPYIVDFYCFPHKIAVEVDGGVHERRDSREFDDLRDAELSDVHGVDVLRFSTQEVRYNLDAVLEIIESRLREAMKK